jgi:hypothetical protein
VTVGRRSQVDQRLAEELSRGATLAKAAEAADVSTRTAERRWSEPAFRQLVIRLQEDARKEREAAMRQAWQGGIRLLGQALVALQDVFQDPNATHLDKTRAARLVLRAYGPKEEPPALKIPSVEEEQRAAQQAEEVARLFEQMGNVHPLRQPAPPAPPAPAWTPPRAPIPEPADDLDDDGDDKEVAVGQEYAKIEADPLRGTPERDPGPVPEVGPPAAELVAVDEEAEALRFLREHPRRPPAGPELMAWLEARRVVGLDQEPQPMRRRRRRGR